MIPLLCDKLPWLDILPPPKSYAIMVGDSKRIELAICLTSPEVVPASATQPLLASPQAHPQCPWVYEKVNI